MHNRDIFSSCVDQQSTREISDDRVGEELVEVRMKDALGLHSLVLDVTDEAETDVVTQFVDMTAKLKCLLSRRRGRTLKNRHAGKRNQQFFM